MDSNTEETKKSDLTPEDFHLKILKDISCEFLSNLFQILTKVGKKCWWFVSSAKETTVACLMLRILLLLFSKI